MTDALALPTMAMFRNQVLNWDALTLLRSMPANSVHCIVTSPPYYGLRDYGTDGQIGLEDTPEQYVARLVELFGAARRVLRDDGVFWLNLGDSYASQGGPEPSQTKWNVDGASNTQNKGRSRNPGGLKPKDLIGIPWRVALALQADGWWLRSDIIWAKPNPMPESVTDRCTVAHEYVFMLTKSARYWYDADAVREAPSQSSVGNRNAFRGNGSYTGGNAFDNSAHRPNTTPGNDGKPAARNRRTVWTVPTEGKPFSHFAMFPQALIEPMILAGCPDTVCSVCGAGYVRSVEYEGRQDTGLTVTDHGFVPACDCNAPTSCGIVLDPFMGSGTTAIVAQRLGRDFIGCDLNAEYVELARKRIEYHGDDKRMVKEREAGVQQIDMFARAHDGGADA